MKKLSLTLFLTLFCSYVFGQSKFIDSLSRELSVATDEKSKVLLLADIANNYRLIKPDTALILGQKALNWAKKINYPHGESAALGSIGAIYRIMGDLQNGMSYCYESISIAKKNDLKVELARGYINMGTIYSDLKEYDLAIKHIRLAISIIEKLDDKRTYIMALSNMGETYSKNNQLDSALFYLQQSHDLIIGSNYSQIVPFIVSRLASTHLKLKNYEIAKDLAKKSLEIGKKEKNARVQCVANQLLSQYHQSFNNLDSAIYYAKQGFEVAQAYRYQLDMLDISNLLSNLYEQKEDINQAYHFAKVFKSLNDSIYGVDRVNALQKKNIEEQGIARDNEAQNLAAQNQLKQNGLLLILGIMAIAGYFLYRNIRQKQKANQNLEITLINLKSTQAQLIQSEKMASLGELTAGIAHEIQNPLNFVNNFSELNSELIKELKNEVVNGNTEEVTAIANDIESNSEKINQHGQRASSIVKGMLEHSRKSSGEKELTDINAMCDEYLRLSYHGLRAKDKNLPTGQAGFNADYKTDLDPNMPKINVVSQDIARVLLNLINNAFQACAENLVGLSVIPQKDQQGLSENQQEYKPLVTVSTKNLGDKIEISVSDNGPGIPNSIRDKIFQPFFTTKPTGQGTGLGLSLAYDIVKSHGGEIKVESSILSGTKFLILLPIANK